MASGKIQKKVSPTSGKSTLGTMTTSETTKAFTATHNGYVSLDTGNVGANNPSIKCHIFIIAKAIGMATTYKVPSYTGAYMGFVPVAKGDSVTVELSGHVGTATIYQIY